MYTIVVDEECSCFKKSDMENNMTFDNREDMLNKARVMECLMNQQFCMTHYFEAVDYGEKIVMHRTVRPVDEDDDDVEDAVDLVRGSKMTIGFDGSEASPKVAGGN